MTDQAIPTDPVWSTIALLAVRALRSLWVKSGSGVKANELKKRSNDFSCTGNPDRKDLKTAPLHYVQFVWSLILLTTQI